jgi:hypothetical protein
MSVYVQDLISPVVSVELLELTYLKRREEHPFARVYESHYLRFLKMRLEINLKANQITRSGDMIHIVRSTG